MSDEKGRPIGEADCPVHTAIGCGVQSLRRLTILGRGGRPVAVDTHAIPVIADDGITQGAILLLHDASSETSLEQRCQSLHEKATKDPLTQVANRAEFDRVHAMFIAAHQQQQVPCSLLMCDLDRFKLVNDTYGHQAGDEAIKSLAALAEERLPAGRSGGPLRRRRVRRCSAPIATTPPPAAAPNRSARRSARSPQPKHGRPLGHRQLRRDRDSAGRHARDHAPPRRPCAC